MTMRISIGLAGLGALALVSCSEPNRPMREFSVAEPAAGAAALATRVEMPGGLLEIESAASGGVTARFRHDHDKMEPRLEFALEGDAGRVKVHAPDFEEGLGRTHNEWRVQLGAGRPHELDVNMGTGMLRLAAGNIDLRALKACLTQGVCELDFATGPWRHDLAVAVEIGTGEARIVVPNDVGVRLRCKENVGDVEVIGLAEQSGVEDTWVNDLFGRSEVTVDLVVRVGWGTTRVEARAAAATPSSSDGGGG
jgi:hypothetical protein